MKKSIGALFAFIFIFSILWLKADNDVCASPYFFIKSSNPESSWMPLKSTQTNVKITGVIANVQVQQVYVNESKQKLDATYVFPASTKAAVYGLDMVIGKRVIHAKVMEKDSARKEFDKAKKEGKRSTLLEQDRPNVFTMEVANILPGDTIKVDMFYTELLEYRNKEYEFVYPVAVGPRYSTENEEFVKNSIQQLMSHHKPKFDIKVNIDGAIPVQMVESPSHQIKTNRISETTTQISLSNPLDDDSGNKDFVLKYSLQGEKIETGLTLYEHNDEKFFLLMMQPPAKVTNQEILPREYIFIIDVSGSMYGFPLEITKSIIKKLLLSIHETDRFNVLLFESNREMLSDVSLPATTENICKAWYFIDERKGGGGTELYSALQAAFDYKDEKTKDYARTFIIATDGFVTVESKVFKLIADNIDNASFVPLGIGDNTNRFLIEGMAWAGASEPFIITNKTEAENVGEHLISTISQPLLTDVSIDWGTFGAYDIYPEKVPVAFSERPIVVFGKYKESANATIMLKGKTPNGNYKENLSIKKATRSNNEALRYLWARNKIKYLSDYSRNFADNYKVRYQTQDNKNKNEIVELGLKYNLLTKYTSFLAVDDKMDIDAMQADNENTVGEIIDEVKQVKSKTTAASHVDEIFVSVEQQPQYPGGQAELLKYLTANLNYPDDAKTQGIEGRVVVQFVVGKDGYISDVKVLQALFPSCDKEAILLISSMPRWIPGKQNGKAVDVYYTIPIRFKLQENKKETENKNNNETKQYDCEPFVK